MTISPPIFNGVHIVNRPDPDNVWRLDRGSMPMINEMERNGMRVDKSHIITLHERLTGEMETLSRSVTELTGREINLGSGDQLSQLLFKELKLKQAGKEKWTKSKSRLAADSDVLKGMITQHPCIKPILEWKEREKLRSTYTYSLIGALDPNSRLHTDISSTTAETGRLTSSNPNLQNIPIRTKLGKEIRNAFIASPGCVLGTIDASQIEMRQHAHDSQDANMLDTFRRRDDFYWATAELMYHRKFSADERKHGMVEGRGVSYKEWYRFNAKTTTLGVSYDISPGGLLDQFFVSNSTGWIEDIIGIPVAQWTQREVEAAEKECAKIIIGWFGAYPGILTRRKVHHKRAFRYGFVWDMWGRVRWIPQVKSVHQWIVGEGLRQAGNMPIQGAAAGIIKLWMAVLWSSVESYWKRFGLKMLMQIHDELLCEGPLTVVEAFLDFAQHMLEELLPSEFFSVPLEAGWITGEKWGELEK